MNNQVKEQARSQRKATMKSPDEVKERAESMATQCMEEAKHFVENYPASTMIASMGIGIGVGLLIGLYAAGSSKSRMEEAEDFFLRFRDSFADMLPKSLSRHVHS